MDGKALAASFSAGENKFHKHCHERNAQQPKACEIISTFPEHSHRMYEHLLTPKLADESELNIFFIILPALSFSAASTTSDIATSTMFVIVKHGLEYPNRRKNVWNVSVAAAENKSRILVS